MSQLPPKAHLERVLGALAKHLPAQLAVLIEAPRFDEERGILERFTDGDWAHRAVVAMTEAEAGWLADLLLERWAAVGEVLLDPVAAIKGPREVWVGKRSQSLRLEVIVEGLDQGWSATWRGDIVGDATGPVVLVEAIPSHSAAFASAQVRVEGRVGDKRTLLLAQTRIPVRVPRLLISEKGTQILVQDQDERPAVGVAVRIGDGEYRTDSAGRILLDESAAEGSEIRVEGVRAGRIPSR